MFQAWFHFNLVVYKYHHYPLFARFCQRIGSHIINETHNLEGKAIYICIWEEKDNTKERKNMIEIGSVAFSITSHERGGKSKM